MNGIFTNIIQGISIESYILMINPLIGTVVEIT
jgi:hypothetical protein